MYNLEKLKKMIREEILRESLQSEKLRKLVSTELGKDYKRIFDSIARQFKIAIDQVTDDDVIVVRGSVARKIMSDPNKLGIFIWKGENTYSTPRGLMGIRLGKKFISVNTAKAMTRYTYNDNPKDIRNQKVKNPYLAGDVGIRGTTGSSRSDRYGGSGLFSAGDYWSNEVIVYVIDTAKLGGTAAAKIDSRYANKDAFRTMEMIRNLNRNRYRKALADLRSTQSPELIQKYETQLKELGTRVEKVTSKIIANPEKYRYRSGVDKLLSTLMSIYSDLQYVISEFKSGDANWYKGYHAKSIPVNISKFMEMLDSLEKI